MIEKDMERLARYKLPDPNKHPKDEISTNVIGWKLIACPPFIMKIRETVQFRKVLVHIGRNGRLPFFKRYKWEVMDV